MWGNCNRNHNFNFQDWIMRKHLELSIIKVRTKPPGIISAVRLGTTNHQKWKINHCKPRTTPDRDRKWDKQEKGMWKGKQSLGSITVPKQLSPGILLQEKWPLLPSGIWWLQILNYIVGLSGILLTTPPSGFLAFHTLLGEPGRQNWIKRDVWASKWTEGAITKIVTKPILL